MKHRHIASLFILPLLLTGCFEGSNMQRSTKYPELYVFQTQDLESVETTYSDYLSEVKYNKDVHYSTVDYTVGGTCMRGQYLILEKRNKDNQCIQETYASTVTGIMYSTLNQNTYNLSATGDVQVYNPQVVREIEQGLHLDYKYLESDFPEVAKQFNIPKDEQLQSSVNEATTENEK